MEQHLEAPSIAIVRSSRPWARTLHRYVVDYGGAIVRARPMEERQAIEEDYDILVVDDVSSFLNNHIIEELHRRGRRVLGVFDGEEFSPSGESGSGRQRLLRLGVDTVIESTASPEEFVRMIEDLAPTRVPRETPLSIGQASAFGDEPSALQQVDLEPAGGGGKTDRRRTPRYRRGLITAVIGASGGAGVTEVAIELARSLGGRGEKTVLIDGDELAPSMAQRLGLALHPNLRTAIDVVEHGSGRLSDTLVAVASGLEVLVGLPHPRDWVDVRGSDMVAIIEEISRNRPHTVINTSPSIEDLTSYGGPDRFGMSRSVLSAADHVVIVCQPSPMGVARLIDRVADLSTVAEGKPVHVVVNRVPKGPFKRNEIAYEIRRSLNLASIHFVPADPKVESAAWEGTLVLAGEFTRMVASDVASAIPRSELSNQRPQRPVTPTAPAGTPPRAVVKGA